MTAQVLDFTNAHRPHPEAVEFIERGSWNGKPIVGVAHEIDEGGDPVTILTVRSGNATASVVFDSFEGDEDGLS